MDGAKALEIFYNESLQYNTSIPNTIEQFRVMLNSHPDRSYRNIIPTLNNIIDVMKADSWFQDIDVKVTIAMEELAKKSKGYMPDANAFTSALSGQFTSLHLKDYARLVEQSVVELADKGLAEFNWWKKNYRFLALGGGALAIYIAIKQVVPNIGKMKSSKR